jgi:hypothetical protein
MVFIFSMEDSLSKVEAEVRRGNPLNPVSAKNGSTAKAKVRGPNDIYREGGCVLI